MSEYQKTYDLLSLLILNYLREMESEKGFKTPKTRLNRLGIEIRRLMITVEEGLHELQFER